MLAEALQQLEAFRLLLGRPPELENLNTDDGVVDLQRFYRERLRETSKLCPSTGITPI
jgi:hypothetical protein